MKKLPPSVRISVLPRSNETHIYRSHHIGHYGTFSVLNPPTKCTMVYPGQLNYTQFKATRLNRPIDDPGRKLRVVCVGAGISGLTTIVRFNQHLADHVEVQVYDKNEG
jgi:hypothetical protein